jgi:hypothetical protein
LRSFERNSDDRLSHVARGHYSNLDESSAGLAFRFSYP